MKSESSRQWFSKTQAFAGGTGDNIIVSAGTNKIPVVTYVNVLVVTAAAFQVSVIGSISSIVAAVFETATAGTKPPWGPLYSGIKLAAGDSVFVSFSGGAAAVTVTVEGYYDV